MSKKQRGRQNQVPARKKGKKGKPVRRTIGAGGGPGAAGALPAGRPGGMPSLPPGAMPSLPPGQQLPDLTKLRFDAPDSGPERRGR